MQGTDNHKRPGWVTGAGVRPGCPEIAPVPLIVVTLLCPCTSIGARTFSTDVAVGLYASGPGTGGTDWHDAAAEALDQLASIRKELESKQ